MEEAAQPGAPVQHTREGWLTKLSGYLVKLAYYPSPQDDVPRRIIELDGCTVEPAADGSVLLVERSRSPPHRYVIRSDDQQEMTEWIEAIKLASVLYQEIFYAAIVRDEGKELEHCFPHWSDQANVFRNLTKEALVQQRKSTADNSTPRRHVYERHKTYKVCSIGNESIAFVCIVEKRLANYKPEAFLEDVRETYQAVTSGNEAVTQEGDFERRLQQMMQVYSPGYHEAKAPELVANANRWLKKLLAEQSGNQAQSNEA